MNMIPGAGTIADYATYIKGCTLGQFPYKIPVNSLADVQLYIDIGVSGPGSASYELIHTCGPTGGAIESITPGEYVTGQDTNDNYYGVFRAFTGANPTCFVIAITLGSDIYFSEEYCIESGLCANPPVLIKGCYGNLDPLISYDREGIYFGVSQGNTLGDATVVYKHELLLRGVETNLSAIKNTFKQGRTRNFRIESEDIIEFMAEPIPEWYIREIDSIFKRGEVFIGGTRYLVNETAFEKVEECLKIWKPTATLKESYYQSFSCEADPCGPPVPEESGGGGGGESGGGESGGGSTDQEISIALINPCNGINSSYLVSGLIAGDIVTVRASFGGIFKMIGGLFTRADLSISSPDGTASGIISSTCYADASTHGFTITADTIITAIGTTAVVNVAAVTNNSSEVNTNVGVTAILLNGVDIFVSTIGCRGNSSTGGTC